MDDIKNSVLECIGHTPTIRMSKLMADESLECELVGKCEFLNPGGSTKDRVALEMIRSAEQRGQIGSENESTLIEPTSGNTGISIGLIGPLLGYQVVCTMKQKSSMEKVLLMNYLGVQLQRTPTNVPPESPQNHINTAIRMSQQRKHSTVLNQYANPDNPKCHAEHTAVEMWEQCGQHIDALFVGVGTGGSVTGMGRRLKQLNPNIRIVAIEPSGSLFASKPVEQGPRTALNERSYWVEGIGFDIVPGALDVSVVDEWITVADGDAFRMARKLARLEGLLCGGSSGAITHAAVQWCKQNGFGSDKRVVVILPDTVRNYFTKFVDPYWMVRHGFDELAAEFESKSCTKDFKQIPHQKVPSMNEKCNSKDEIMQAFLNFPVIHLRGSERMFIEQFVYFRQARCKEPFGFDALAVDAGELEEVFHLATESVPKMEFLFERYKYGMTFMHNAFCLYERNSFYRAVYGQ